MSFVPKGIQAMPGRRGYAPWDGPKRGYGFMSPTP